MWWGLETPLRNLDSFHPLKYGAGGPLPHKMSALCFRKVRDQCVGSCLLVRDQCVGRKSTRKWGDQERRLFTGRVSEGLMVAQTKVVAMSDALYRGGKAHRPAVLDLGVWFYQLVGMAEPFTGLGRAGEGNRTVWGG